VRVDRHDTNKLRRGLGLDEHTQTAIATAGAAVELLKIARREQLAVWIVELLHQPGRGLFIDVRLRQRIDEALGYERHHLIQQRRTFALGSSLQEESTSDDRDQQGAGERELTIALHE